MKKRFKLVLSSCFVAMLIFASVFSNYQYVNAAEITNNGEEKIDVNSYPKNSRQRFVASLAVKYNISYAEADALEKKEAMKSTGITIDAFDETVKYKTVEKQVATITSGGVYTQPVYMATEVRYVWNRGTNRLVNIESIGAPLTYLPGISASGLSMNSGGYNTEKYSKTARISETVVFSYEVQGVSVSVGGDIIGVSSTIGGYRITTRAKTLVLNISESDLR